MRILLLVVALAGCGGDGDDGGKGGDAAVTASDAAHQLCVTETNQDRATAGKAAVQYDAALEAYANTGAQHDFGTAPHDHFSTTSGGGIAFAENECPQQGNWTITGDLSMTVAACVKAFFDEGPGGGHYENMMGDYATLGCGIYVQGDQLTIVQDYGH